MVTRPAEGYRGLSGWWSVVVHSRARSGAGLDAYAQAQAHAQADRVRNLRVAAEVTPHVQRATLLLGVLATDHPSL